MKISQIAFGGIGLVLSLAIDLQAQNVGIGFSNPASKLTVNGNFAVGADYNAAAPTNGAIIEGNVGIGTSTPLSLLNVFNGDLYLNNTAGNSYFRLINTDGGFRIFRDGPNYTDSPFDNGYIDFDSTAGVPNARIFYYQGLSSLSAPVNVGAGLAFESGNPNGFPQMVLQNTTGFLGLATNNPRFRLEVQGIAAVVGGSYPTTGNCFALGWDVVQPGLGTGELVDYSGTGGGNAFDFFRVTNSGAPTTANIISDIDTAGAYQQVSDQRVKTNIQGLRYGLREVMALEPKEYDIHAVQSMTDGKPEFASGEKHQFGFIAQQVIQVVPEAVEKPADPSREFYKIGYTSFIPVLVSAVQELKHLQDETVSQQQARITQQETEIAALQAELASLKASNDKLAAIAAKVEALEKAVSTVQERENGGVRTAALTQ